MPPPPKIMLHITYRPAPLGLGPTLVFCGKCHALVDGTRTQAHTDWHRENDK